ncbi:MAG: agmatine deiminase family protein [Candidatus Hydrogenedens sp.]|nr:agmatine deiminase family protein [Candidatus Hydrogenedens sp.]
MAAVRLPAEFEHHDATLLAWPHNPADWPGKITPARWAFVEFIRHAAESEYVHLIVPDEKTKAVVRRMLADAHADLGAVRLRVLPLDRNWMRDCAPAFVHSGGKVKGVQFGFTAWAKYPNWQQDAKLPAAICKALQIPLAPARKGRDLVVLEGGAIDSNGLGTLLTTEECLLHPEVQVRNPGWGRADYERMFGEQLGIQQVLWLGDGIAGDDTHGHVDDLCRFVSKDTVVLCEETDPADANYRPLQENRERLQGVKLAFGKRLQVVSLPMPAPLNFRGIRLPASYANFYITNQAVLVPTFNDPNDHYALGILGELFPKRRVIGIHAVDLVWGFGTLHCLSHEIPAGEEIGYLIP